MLPTSQSGQTLNVPRHAAPDPSAYDTTPALRALDVALQKGIVTFDQVFDHLNKIPRAMNERQRLQEDTANSQDRMEIRPLKKQLTTAEMESALRGIPLRDQSLERNAEVEELKIRQLKDAVRMQGEDPTGARKNLRESYQKLTGKLPPTTPEGGFDYATMEAEVSSLLAEERDLSTQKMSADIEKAKTSGNRGSLTALQAQDTRDQILALDETIQAFERAVELVDSPSNPVGPLAGSFVGRAGAWIKAVGLNPQQYEDQRELETALNKQVAQMTQALKGALSEKELRFIRDSVPKLSDTEAVWKRYMARVLPLIKQARENKVAELGGETHGGSKRSNEDDSESGVRGGLPVVRSQADYDAIPEGGEYYDAQGNKRTKKRRTSTVETPAIRPAAPAPSVGEFQINPARVNALRTR